MPHPKRFPESAFKDHLKFGIPQRKFIMSQSKLILDHVLSHEQNRPDFVYMTQPIGNNQVIDYTWRNTLQEARSMAAYLKSQGLQPGARVAILSKNCAHFIMAELAIWMAGGTTVAIFPTESGETIRYVLDHSEASFCSWANSIPGRCKRPLCQAHCRVFHFHWHQTTIFPNGMSWSRKQHPFKAM